MESWFLSWAAPKESDEYGMGKIMRYFNAPCPKIHIELIGCYNTYREGVQAF
jgi:hypothetical protein